MKEPEPLIYNNNRKDHTYVTIVITHNYKVLENLQKNHKLISPDIDEDDTLKIYQMRPHNLYIESKKKPYILASNSYINGCKSGSTIYLITTDNSSIISDVAIC